MIPMSEEQKVLTKEIAAKFIKGDRLNLTRFTTIENDAAKMLSKHKGALKLNGLTELGDAAATSGEFHSFWDDQSAPVVATYDSIEALVDDGWIND